MWTLPAAFEPGSWRFRYCSFSKVITTTSFIMNFPGISRLEVSPQPCNDIHISTSGESKHWHFRRCSGSTSDHTSDRWSQVPQAITWHASFLIWRTPKARKCLSFCRKRLEATKHYKNIGSPLLGLHAQKKQSFVLDSWIVTVTAEHAATCTNNRMRPEDSLMHHDLRFCCIFLGFRSLAPLRMSAFISCPWQIPQSLAKQSTALRKNHWSCSVHQEYPRDAMQFKEKWSVATPLGCQHVVENVQSLRISPVTHTFFNRKVSSSYIEGHPVFHQGISMRPVLPCQAEVARALQTFSHGLLTRTSWHLSNISHDITALWVHGSTSFDINRANGMLSSNAKCIFCDNGWAMDEITCWGKMPLGFRFPHDIPSGFAWDLKNKNITALFIYLH